MADGALIQPRQGTWRRLPVAARIGILYVAARCVTMLFFIVAAALAGDGGADGPELLMRWDAQWYWFVAWHGYPAVLPLTDAGLVAENQWAFMPVYPYLAQGLSWIVGSWPVAAIGISLVSGYLACLVLYRMLRLKVDATAAMWAVLLFACAPLASIFQTGYAEALFLLWLFLALLALMQRRYGWLYLLIPLMGYTRPGILAFALLLGLYGIHRWVTRRRDPLPAREIVNIVALGVLAVAVGFSWQVIAAVVTGDPAAYLQTELAWRRNWLTAPEDGFVPLSGFIEASAFWFTSWGLPAVAGYIALALLVAGTTALLLFGPHVRRLGIELRLWSASYIVYLLLVFFPQSSIFRLLVPLSPLWGAVAQPRQAAWRVGALGCCLVAQAAWIYFMYGVGSEYWQIP